MTTNDTDKQSLDIRNMISVDFLIAIENRISEAFGIRMSTLAPNGGRITISEKFAGVCNEYINIENQEGSDHEGECKAVRKENMKVLKDTEKVFKKFKCGSGFESFIVPIIYEGKYIGYLWGGLYLTDFTVKKEIINNARTSGCIRLCSVIENYIPIVSNEIVEREYIPLVRNTALLIQSIVEEKLRAQVSEDALTAKQEQFKRLFNIVSGVAEAKQLDDIYEMVLKEVCSSVKGYEWAVISLFEGESLNKMRELKKSDEESQLLDSSDFVRYCDEMRLSSQRDCISHWVFKNQKTIRINDLETDKNYFSHFEKAKSLVVSPISTRDNLHGTLGVYSSQPYSFDTDDELLISLLSYQTAAAKEIQSHFQHMATMATFVSHQITAPITAIKSHMENLLEGIVPLEDQRETYESIFVSAKNALSVARNSAFLSQILRPEKYSGVKNTLNKKQLLTILSDSSLDFRGKCIQKNLRIKIDVHSFNKLVNIRVDELLFPQVILLLLDNAVKYSDEKTTIRIFCLVSKKEIEIAFENYTAMAIAAHEEKRIFELGFRSRDARFLEPVGTGSGCFLIEKIMELHGGEVKLKVDGQKVTFKIIFPL